MRIPVYFIFEEDVILSQSFKKLGKVERNENILHVSHDHSIDCFLSPSPIAQTDDFVLGWTNIGGGKFTSLRINLVFH